MFDSIIESDNSGMVGCCVVYTNAETRLGMKNAPNRQGRIWGYNLASLGIAKQRFNLSALIAMDKQKCFIVITANAYGNREVEGVFSSNRKARFCARKFLTKKHQELGPWAWVNNDAYPRAEYVLVRPYYIQ
jgi:hypothetical protein